MGKVEDNSEVSILNNRENDNIAMQIRNLGGEVHLENIILSYV